MANLITKGEKSREWHLDRISELQFLRQKELEGSNRAHTTFSALLSVVVVFFIFELGNQEKNITKLISLGFLIGICIWGITNEADHTKKYDIQIQHNFDTLLRPRSTVISTQRKR